MKEIYIIRHGQTDYNLKGIVQGRGVDSSLNATGRAQAQAFYEKYKHLQFDHVYISNLQRTYQTAQHFIDAGVPFTKNGNLDEINWGIYEGVPHDPAKKEEYEAIIQEWYNGNLDIKIEGGESAKDLQDRLGHVVELLKNIQDDRILVCTHGRTLRALVCLLNGQSVAQMDSYSHSNTCLYKFKLDENGFHLAVENSTEHLPTELKPQ